MTLTVPAVNRARSVMFLAAGEGKTEMVKRLVARERHPRVARTGRRVAPGGRVRRIVSMTAFGLETEVVDAAARDRAVARFR